MIQTLKTLILCAALAGHTASLAQSHGTVKGRVIDGRSDAVPFASISIDSLQLGTVADADGYFVLKNVPVGAHRIKAASMGMVPVAVQVLVAAGRNAQFNPVLRPDMHRLSEVTVEAEAARSAAELVGLQSYAVTSIDVKPLQNLNTDVNTVLNRSSGIRIRQSGGMGSDFNFSLNGFSGNQVRFFIDGLPADHLGEAMQFNNIPVNVIERVEVYKGVVPVHLGADALGGAVNIITSNNSKDFIDLSYGYGSFNTHQAALASRLTFKQRYVLNVSGFFNWSDNDFVVDAPTVDPNTGSIGSPKPYKLFNEQYMSGSGLIEGGVVNTRWADRLLVGLIASGNKKHYQRGQTMVLHPIGEAYSTDMGYIPTLKYQKQDLFTKGLSLNISSFYSYTQSLTVDTSSRIYNWDGTYSLRAFGSNSGEFSWYKSMFRFTDHATVNTATLEYVLRKRHTFTFNNTYSYFNRQGTDPVASEYSGNLAFDDPNTLGKNITGLSYRIGLWNSKWNTTVFGKLFHLDAKVNAANSNGDLEMQHNQMLEHGEGVATSVQVLRSLLIKASYEHTSRLPESYEMMGDGKLLMPNPTLLPERSHNLNVGALYGSRFGTGHILSIEGGFVYRKPQDMIRLVSMGVLSVYQNLTAAKVMCGELALRYGYRHWVNIELNATYQDMRNDNRTIDTYPDPLYNDRIPNIPYLFGNASVAAKSPEMGKQKWQVGLNWATMYVEQFYLNWPSQGSANSKLVIPRQLSHDLSVALSALGGRYNISFTCANVADADLYDNFKVQRPGRSYNMKLRMYLSDFIRKPKTINNQNPTNNQ